MVINQKNNIPPLNHENKTIIDPKQKAEILHKTLAYPLPPQLENKHIDFHNKIAKMIKTKSNPNEKCHIKYNDILNAPILQYDITNCINDLENDKAYGPDLIHNLMIKNGDKRLINKLQII